jgi:hypothetical protein
MRTLLQWAARLYPPVWRERYGGEFDSLLDDVNPRWTDVADVCRGGLEMQLLRGRTALVVIAFGIAGAILAGAAVAARAEVFASGGTLDVSGADVREVTAQVLSESARNDIARSHGLGAAWLGQVEVVAVAPAIARVSFIDPDAARAQRVAADLMARFAGYGGQGAQLSVIEAPKTPDRPMDSHLAGYVGGGFGVGALFGALLGVVRRRA